MLSRDSLPEAHPPPLGSRELLSYSLDMVETTPPSNQPGTTRSQLQSQVVPTTPATMLDNSGKFALKLYLLVRYKLYILCLGFFVAGDESNAKAQSLFICECKAFDNLCTGLTQPCQCRSNARRMIKTIQLCIANSDELAKL